MVIRLALLSASLAALPTVGDSSWRRAGAAVLGAATVLGWPPLALPAAALFLTPWLRQRFASWRLREAKRAAFPDLLLSLRLAAEDGRGAVLALEALPPSHFGPLASALERFRSELRATFDARRALHELKSALDFPEGQRFIEALLAGETLGVPLRTTLENQHDLVRATRLAVSRQRSNYLPYALTLVAGLALINSAIVFGYPHLLSLLSTFGFFGKGL